MYEPVFNSVLVEIDDKDAQWGSGNDESMLGKSYSKGKVIGVGDFIPDANHPTKIEVTNEDLKSYIRAKVLKLVGKSIMWNEGVEAGTTFEFDGKLFGMIYWWDIRGIKVEA
jgi:hypothetical protein